MKVEDRERRPWLGVELEGSQDQAKEIHHPRKKLEQTSWWSGREEEMMPDATPYASNTTHRDSKATEGWRGMLSSSVSASGGIVSPEPGADTHCSSLLYSFSILRDKVRQVESIVGMVVSPSQMRQELVPMAVASAGTAVQEIISAASSMMLAFQQLALDAAAMAPDELSQHNAKVSHEGSSQQATSGALTGRGGGCFFHGEAVPQEGYSTASIHTSGAAINEDGTQAKTDQMGAYLSGELSGEACEIIELRAADLLAKYTHHCQVCGKGFKRDANLRMHMRAHGDEYKTNAALSNPLKQHGNKHLLGFDGSCSTVTVGSSGRKRYYSCPQEGCRWNRKHPRFQPLKSMVCAKKHYERSHCPKMYVCNRCNRKQFSVLSDLRTHEKHCGDLRWQCSCGTTFSRKDKLMGHVSLFVGHAPAAECPPIEARGRTSSTGSAHLTLGNWGYPDMGG